MYIRDGCIELIYLYLLLTANCVCETPCDVYYKWDIAVLPLIPQSRIMLNYQFKPKHRQMSTKLGLYRFTAAKFKLVSAVFLLRKGRGAHLFEC